MGRHPREYHPHGIYQLTQHGIDDRPVFRDDTDRQEFTVRLARSELVQECDLLAACLMETHYHLLVRPRAGDVSKGMRDLNGGYARAFNKRHGRRGAVFEARYRDWTIRDEEHLANTKRYIEWNPVKDGRLETVEAWPWTTGWDSPLRRALKLPKGV